jgi:pilus assembly protein CpaF
MMDLEDQLRGDAAGANSARLTERLQATEPHANPFSGRREAPVDPYGGLKTQVQRAVIAKLGPRLFGSSHATSDLRKHVTDAVAAELENAQDETPLAHTDRERLTRELTADILGYGPIEPYLADDDVTEIMVNGYNRIYVERFGVIEATNGSFVDDDHLLRIIDKIVSQVGRRVDEASPMVDARLPDGSRVNAIIPPLSLLGPTLTIRKFSRDPYTIDDLIGFGSLTETSARFLEACVVGKLNVLISGGTGTGKTTMLNALSAFIPEAERIVTIEDAAELQLQQDHWVRLESRPANVEGEGEVRIRELVRNALRMRPDRIVVGEVRGGETLDMLQAMNTGHEGSLTTIHANSPRDALNRLETMVLMSGIQFPLKAIREQVASALDVIIHLSRLVDGSRRVSRITEVVGMESEVVTLQDVFVARPMDERAAATGDPGVLLRPLEPSGLQPHFRHKLAAQGVEIPDDFYGIDRVVAVNGGRGR